MKNSESFNWFAEEFRALRAEVILCLERRSTILSYGFASIAAIWTSGVVVLEKSRFLFVIIMIIVAPLFLWFCMNMWLTETRRLRRASRYIWYLEKKIYLLEYPFKHNMKPLEWEGNLRKKGNHGDFCHHYIRTIIFFCSFIFINLFVGILILLKKTNYLKETINVIKNNYFFELINLNKFFDYIVAASCFESNFDALFISFILSLICTMVIFITNYKNANEIIQFSRDEPEL